MIRIGMVGAGPMGSGNARQFVKQGGRCKISVVADPNQELAHKLADPLGAKVADDYTKIFDDVDAVVISTPNFMHSEQTVVSAQAGKHVFIEKPMALTTADADKMVEAIAKAKVASMVGFSVRFEGIMQTMKQIHEAGRIGDIYSLFSRRLCGWPQGRGWRGEYAKSGGVMSELIAHEVDWIVAMAGVPKSVYCRKRSRSHDDPRDNEHLWMTLVFGDEVTGTIEGSQMAIFADYYRGVVGTKGSIATREWGKDLYWQDQPNKSEKVELGPAFDKHGHFLDVIEGKCASVADVKYGREIVRISEKAIESAVSGKVVDL
jgi:predicted dehydrogenase